MLRTSIVTDPADGRIPPVNAEGQKRAQERAAARQGIGPFDSAQNARPLRALHLLGARGSAAPADRLQLEPADLCSRPSDVRLIPEMMPAARVVPLDGRAHARRRHPRLRGDSRGRWEGDTMVIETTNFSDRTAFRGSSEHLKVTERLTLDRRRRPSATSSRSRIRTRGTRPWSGEYPMTRIDEPIYEYACHEGNYGMPNILKAQRAVEAQERAKAAADQQLVALGRSRDASQLARIEPVHLARLARVQYEIARTAGTQVAQHWLRRRSDRSGRGRQGVAAAEARRRPWAREPVPRRSVSRSASSRPAHHDMTSSPARGILRCVRR